jgi:glycosyltransferase involved in cell wall biosynthesis
MKTTITTVIPTFRRPHLLKRAIRSVLAQSYTDFQLLVLDNASGDETSEVVARIASQDPRVSYYCHASNIGAWSNFKFGLDTIDTPYFNLLSDDDALLPGFFATALDSLKSYPHAGMFAGATIRFAPGFISTPVLKWPQRFFPPPQAFLEILRRDFPDWNAIMFKRETLSRVGSIDVTFEQAIDLDFICRCAAECGMVVHPVPFAILTLGHDHLSKRLYSPASHANYWLRILRRYETAPWIDDDAREAFDAARAWIARKVLRNAVDAAASWRNAQALEAADCLKASFAMASAPLLLRLMTADSAIGALSRRGWQVFHFFCRTMLSPIRCYSNKDDLRSVTAALALQN